MGNRRAIMAAERLGWVENPSGLWTSWEELRRNPLFMQAFFPRRAGQFLRSPVLHFLFLVAIGAAVVSQLHILGNTLPMLIVVIAGLWVVIDVYYRISCWLSLRKVIFTGRFQDYLNSGLSKEELVLGIVYPYIILGELAVVLLLAALIFFSDRSLTFILVGALIIFLRMKDLFGDLFVFYPKLASYLRPDFGNIFGVVLASVVRIAGRYLFFGVLIVILAIVLNMAGALAPNVHFIAVVVCALAFRYLSGPVMKKWYAYRLEKFYDRYQSLDQLLDDHIVEARLQSS